MAVVIGAPPQGGATSDPDGIFRAMVLTDRQAADLRAKQAVTVAERELRMRMEFNFDFNGLERCLIDTSAELMNHVINAYVPLYDGADPQVRLDLVAAVSNAMSSFVMSSYEAHKGGTRCMNPGLSPPRGRVQGGGYGVPRDGAQRRGLAQARRAVARGRRVCP